MIFGVWPVADTQHPQHEPREELPGLVSVPKQTTFGTGQPVPVQFF